MALKYPTIRIRLPFSRARAILYEDYLAIESLHSFGMVSEDSRTYYDEIRWVLRFRRRDWFRAGHAFVACFPLGIGILFLALSESVIASAFGMALTLPCAMWFVYSVYRFFAVPRGVAAVYSSRGTVEIGVDWPKSSNPLKDAGKFFDTLLGRLKLVSEMPRPAPVPPPASAAPPESVAAPAPVSPPSPEGAVPPPVAPPPSNPAPPSSGAG